MKYKLIVFDLVGTLTEEDALYKRLHRIANCIEQAKANVKKYLKNEIGETELILTNVSYHAKAGIKKEQMIEEANKLELRPKAGKIIEALKQKGFKTGLITSDYNISAQCVKQKLGLDYAFGCKEEFDKNNRLIKCTEILDSKGKLLKLIETAASLGIGLENCIYIGNDVNDIQIFKKVGFPIAFNASEDVKKFAAESIDDGSMEDLLQKIIHIR